MKTIKLTEEQKQLRNAGLQELAYLKELLKQQTYQLNDITSKTTSL